MALELTKKEELKYYSLKSKDLDETLKREKDNHNKRVLQLKKEIEIVESKRVSLKNEIKIEKQKETLKSKKINTPTTPTTQK